MKPQSIAHLLNGSEHIYWILDLEGEVHSIWDLWVSGLQECKSNEFFSKSGGRAAVFGRVHKFIFFSDGRLAPPDSSVRKVRRGVFNVLRSTQASRAPTLSLPIICPSLTNMEEQKIMSPCHLNLSPSCVSEDIFAHRSGSQGKCLMARSH